MPKKTRFQPVALDDHISLNARQNACLLSISDAQGNIIELAMTVDFGAKLVAETRAAFLALENHRLEEGITPEQRREFGSKAAQLSMRITAKADPHLAPLGDVRVTVAPASTYEQSFGLPIEWAEELVAELQTAIRQARQNQE